MAGTPTRSLLMKVRKVPAEQMPSMTEVAVADAVGEGSRVMVGEVDGLGDVEGDRETDGGGPQEMTTRPSEPEVPAGAIHAGLCW